LEKTLQADGEEKLLAHVGIKKKRLASGMKFVCVGQDFVWLLRKLGTISAEVRKVTCFKIWHRRYKVIDE
jgi:hypothetical protein